MAKKKGINAVQRLMNVMTILWILLFVVSMVEILDYYRIYSKYLVPNTEGLITKWDIFDYQHKIMTERFVHFILLYFGWLVIFIINYIAFSKITFWHKN